MPATVFVQDLYKIAGIGFVLVGNVRSGTLKVGMKLNIAGKIMAIKSIEAHHQQIQEARIGDNVGFALDGGDYNSLKQIVRTDVTFSDEGVTSTRVPIMPEPIHPKGFFDDLLSVFKKKN